MSLEDGLSRNLLPLLEICYDGKPLLSLAAVNDDDDDDRDDREHRAAILESSGAGQHTAAEDNHPTRTATNNNQALQLLQPIDSLDAEPSTSLLEDSLSWMSSGDSSPAHTETSSPVPFFSAANSPLPLAANAKSGGGRKKSTSRHHLDDDSVTTDPGVEATLHKLKTEGVPRILRHYMQHGVRNDFVRLPGVNSVTVSAPSAANNNRRKGQGLEEPSITSVELIAANDPLVTSQQQSQQQSQLDKVNKTSLADLLCYCAETHVGQSETFEQVLLLIEHIAAKSQLCKYVLSEAGLPLVLQRYLESKPKSVYLVALASLCSEALEIK